MDYITIAKRNQTNTERNGLKRYRHIERTRKTNLERRELATKRFFTGRTIMLQNKKKKKHELKL